MSIPTACPNCRAGFRGAEIPADVRSAFGGQTHFSRVVGIYDHDADTTVAWMCPDCGHHWQRTEPLPCALRSFELVAPIPAGAAPRRRWWQFWKRWGSTP